MGKLFGVGLINALGLFVFFITLIVVLKVVSVKHPIPGVTEVVNTI